MIKTPKQDFTAERADAKNKTLQRMSPKLFIHFYFTPPGSRIRATRYASSRFPNTHGQSQGEYNTFHVTTRPPYVYSWKVCLRQYIPRDACCWKEDNVLL